MENDSREPPLDTLTAGVATLCVAHNDGAVPSFDYRARTRSRVILLVTTLLVSSPPSALPAAGAMVADDADGGVQVIANRRVSTPSTTPESQSPFERIMDTVQIHGFASQAFTYTTANNFQGNTSDGGDFNLTEIGLNGSVRPTGNLHFAAQLLYRRAGADDNGSVRVDYGLMDWSRSLEQGRIGVRLGRIKNPIGLYNETRDVAFTRPSILLPQSIYFDRVRNLEMAADGGQLYLEHAIGPGELTLQAGGGKAQLDNTVRNVFLGPTATGDLDGDILVARGLYELDGGRLRLGISSAWLKMDYDPVPTEFFPGDGDVDLQFWVLSAQYNTEKWSLTSEVVWEPINFDGFSDGYTDFTVTGGYLQGSYRFQPDWEGFVRFDASFTDSKSLSGNRLSKVSGLDRYNFYTKDFGTGLRWDIRKNLMLRAEYHRIRGANWLTLQDNIPISDTRKDWNLFSLQASFRF